jgi:tetratricopeptide (TPR) repeat protein
MTDRLKELDARELCARAYECQMGGRMDEAIGLYRRSIELHPTPEAHTFLGWTLSFLGRYQEAIAECKTAIEIDPDFGNPWNDTGAYLIELGRDEEAIPYLERALEAKRYESRCFPHFNLSRVYHKKGMLQKAEAELRRAIEIDPTYLPARHALSDIRNQIN